ncbi:NPCBM/NEW2 domain-containing protein [Streptomyces sp. NPDC050416]|uniref:NPCBM/NEW2 domain-containing protein n=1 Tax=Streptomyces sp. NPDC050416 TaxID=3365611 RepID=UPI0037B7C749
MGDLMLTGRGYRLKSRTVARSAATTIAVAAIMTPIACGSESEPGQTTATETRAVTSAEPSRNSTRSENAGESPTSQTEYLTDVEPLSFTYPAEGGPADINGKYYPRSVIEAVDKTSIPAVELEYNIGRRWDNFGAVIGIRDDSPSECSVKFDVFVDGKSVYQHVISIGDSVSISIRIHKSLRLKLSVSYAGPIEPREYCYAAWGDARLINKP